MRVPSVTVLTFLMFFVTAVLFIFSISCDDPLSVEEARLGHTDRCSDLESIMIRPGSRHVQREAGREWAELRCAHGGSDDTEGLRIPGDDNTEEEDT